MSKVLIILSSQLSNIVEPDARLCVSILSPICNHLHPDYGKPHPNCLHVICLNGCCMTLYTNKYSLTVCVLGREGETFKQH